MLAACGSDDDDSAPNASSAAGGAEPRAFPVTIAHKYGSTTIESKPERVVVAGLREQDALLALGVVPVATTEWFGEHPGAIFPWATGRAGRREAAGSCSTRTTASRSRRSPPSDPT